MVTPSKEQLEALSSDARSAMWDTLVGLGAATVGEIALALNRSPKGLYHHMRVLENVGLVRVREVRKGTRREEAVYEPTVRQMKLTREVDPDIRAKVARSLMRKAAVAYSRAVQSRSAEELQNRALIGRACVRVSPEIAAEASRRIREVLEWLRSKEDVSAEESYLLTVSISPLV